ncbi:MAG: alpha-N-arabinofuranosidase, partial [Eubacterium sp.]|nr:alpha-N-arabinofuranosidase [Eubacterium sp.]
TDVPYIDCIATFDEEKEEVTVFAVNKSMDEDAQLDINFLDFEGYNPFEFISMDGYDKNDINSFETIKVQPHKNTLPETEGGRMTAHIKPFSWNVIRLKK